MTKAFIALHPGAGPAKRYMANKMPRPILSQAGKGNFDMDSVDYEMMLKSQNGVCAICSGVNSNGDRLAVDHCHKSGKIRGILCRNCNTAIGLLCDDLSRCRAATAYLERTG